MSTGTVVNIRAALAKKLDGTVETIKQKLTESGVLNVDETGVRVNDKLNRVNIFSNDQFTLWIRIASGKNSLTPAELAELGQTYTAILDEGDKEYQVVTEGKRNIQRFREERRLLIRLRKYQDEHLRFLSDFSAPFGNNATEQSAHFMKNKTRVAGGFRSHQGADDHMAIASVIATAKKQKRNLYSMIKDSFNGKPMFESG